MFHISKKVLASKNRATILPDKHAYLINYGVSLSFIVVGLLLLAALFSYHATDNSWFYASSNSITQNKLGVIGAHIADLFYSSIGYTSWWVGLVILYTGLVKFTATPTIKKHWYSFLQYIAFIVLILSSSTLEYIYFHPQISNYLHLGYGGMLGQLMFGKLIRPYQSNITYISCGLFISVCLTLIMSMRLVFVYLAQFMGFIVMCLYQVIYKFLTSRDKNLLELKEQPNTFDEPQNKPEALPPETQLVDSYPSLTSVPLVEAADIIDPGSIIQSVQDHSTDLPFTTEQLIKKDSLDQAPTKLKPRVRLGVKQNNQLPSIDLLNSPKVQATGMQQETLDHVSSTIENKLLEFGVEASILNAMSGPVVTRYELLPSRGVRGDKVVGLAKEIARGLALNNVRIVETIPGKNVMGIEVPNLKRQTIYLKEIFTSKVYHNSSSKLTLALGKDISGEVIVTDLAKMPHLLVAGTTGSGKSVAVNAMILSILFQARPDEVKFIMIDPKMVELSFYQDIPHLLAPVVTDMSQAANALKWAVAEMERRYKVMARLGCKNIVSYNQKVTEAIAKGQPIMDEFNPLNNGGEPQALETWPYIVVIIDELADLMMVAGKKIEQYIARIAQKARAIGIHLIVATQRPSVDVITGLIKANIPARISFQVSSKIDSRTILDQMGAEALLGQGDMLYLQPGSGWTQRVHGAYVDDDELNMVVDYLKSIGKPDYIEEILTGEVENVIPGLEPEDNDSSTVEKDVMFDSAVKFIYESKRCSISALQTRFGIGYNRAARIMNHLETLGMVKRNERNAYEILNTSSSSSQAN